MRKVIAVILMLLTFIPTVLFDLIHAVGLWGQNKLKKINGKIEQFGLR